jgi:phospholipid/cholesterol/gamma-HCH transport system substrate-binding protein
MKEHARNLAVGLTVLVALAMLGGMILLFAGLPEVFQSGQVLRMNFPATSDVREGDAVHLAGLRVGRVTDIAFRDGDPRKGVQFSARIDRDVKIPANVQPRIYTRGFVGGAYLVLVPGGPDRKDPVTGQKLEFLPEDWAEPLDGSHKGTGLFPDELLDAVKGLSKLAGNLNTLFAPPAPAPTQPGATRPAGTQPAPRAATIGEALAKLGRTLDALEAVLGDPQNQANLKTALANLVKVSAQAGEAMAALKGFATEANKAVVDARNVVADARKTATAATTAATRFAKLADHADERIVALTAKLIEDAEKLSAVLASVNRMVTKIESGKGTAGKLLNDPKLYNSILEASEQFTQLTKQLRQLLEHWQKHGIPMKLK